MAKNWNRHSPKKIHKWPTNRKMLNITNHYGNANQNHEISPHTTWMAIIKNKRTTENMCWQGCGGSGTLRHC